MRTVKIRKGLLESINIRLSKGDGDSLKKSVEAARSVLGSISNIDNPTK